MPTKGRALYESNPSRPSWWHRRVFGEAVNIQRMSDALVPATVNEGEYVVARSINPNDALDALEGVLKMVREGKVRIDSFNVTADNALDNNFSIDGRMVAVQTEPPAVKFNITGEGIGDVIVPQLFSPYTDGGYSTGEGVVKPRPRTTMPDPRAAPPEANPWREANWNLTAQGAYVKKYGLEKAEAAARAAGVRLGATKPQEAYLAIKMGSRYGGDSSSDTIRVPINPTYTFEQRLVEKVAGRRVDHFEMAYNVYEMLCDMRLLNNESSPVMMRGFQCIIGDKPLPDDATLAAEAMQANERSGAIANKCALCSQDTRYLTAGDCTNRRCPNKLKTQPPVPPQQRRELIFDD